MNEVPEQKPLVPITLREYFPKGYLDYGKEETVYTVSCYVIHEEGESAESEEDTHTTEVGQDMERVKTTTCLAKLPSCFGIGQALKFPIEARHAIIQALENPKDYLPEVEKVEELKDDHAHCATCCATITFTDEDLQLGSNPHNRPLFVSGYMREQKITRILIDGGSAVNIMPKATMKQLGVTMEELSRSRLMIQGFNQGGQRAIGMIRLDLTIGELSSSTIFHVIDAKTSYNLLLGRPWVHENGVIPSTLHQCFKFYKDGAKKVEADTKPFTEAESYFADAKFYTSSEAIQEVLPAKIPSTGKSKLKGDKQTSLIPMMNISHEKMNVAPTQEKGSSSKDLVSEPNVEAPPPVLRYIPRSR